MERPDFIWYVGFIHVAFYCAIGAFFMGRSAYHYFKSKGVFESESRPNQKQVKLLRDLNLLLGHDELSKDMISSMRSDIREVLEEIYTHK